MTDFWPVAPLFHTDAYKLSHIRQYELAGNVTRIYSNYTNRKSRVQGVEKVVHFGLQAYIQKHLMEGFEQFFDSSKQEVSTAYYERVSQILGKDAADTIGVEHIEDLWELNYLPLRFCALPEGTLVPIGVPAFTVENTHDDFAWLTNYVETGLSAGYWQASTSATIAHEYRKVLEQAARATGASVVDVDYQLHDFSYRGMSSHETAAVSGAAHLLSFSGTDSLVSLDWIDRYYHGQHVQYSAKSVPATEHSVMSCGTATVGEMEMIARLLRLHKTGPVAIVADTYDLWRVLTDYLPKLRDLIMSRDGKLVIRPDSGDPEKILCGNTDPFWLSDRPEAVQGVVRLLAETFGTTWNAAGYKELDPHVGVIYGDSITLDRARSITRRLRHMGFASTTVTFGVGSYTYQMNTRDTFGSAMKATWAEVDGKGVNLFKDPVTDDGTKKSATGRLAVMENDAGDLCLLQEVSPSLEGQSLLQPIWKDGKFLRRQAFDEVRQVLNPK